MSKFEIVVRSLSAAFVFGVGVVISTFVERWVVVQASPSIQFSDGPEQTFGLDALHLLGNGSIIIGLLLAGLLIYPVFKSILKKKETTTNEA